MKVCKTVLFVLLSLFLLAGCGLSEKKTEPANSLTSFEDVANYLKAHNKLPDNFITKNEAKKLGWDPQKGNLQNVAPGKSIGGDIYQNREGKLPNKKGRVWHEADINYKSGHRGKDRIVFSNDGLIYKTEDHYETFQQMK